MRNLKKTEMLYAYNGMTDRLGIFRNWQNDTLKSMLTFGLQSVETQGVLFYILLALSGKEDIIKLA